MTRRHPDEGDARLRTKALICATFHIGWSEYGSLTRREQRSLVAMIAEAHEPQTTTTTPHATKPPAPPGMERIV